MRPIQRSRVLLTRAGQGPRGKSDGRVYACRPTERQVDLEGGRGMAGEGAVCVWTEMSVLRGND